MIVIDFIDMVLESNRDLVLRRLTECLGRDRTKHQVAEVTSLGLVQMTRKRVGGGLLEHFSTPCEHCRGRGVIVNAEPMVEVEIDHGPDRSERETPGRRSRGGRGRRDSGDGDSEREGRRDSGRRNGSVRSGSPVEVFERTRGEGSARGGPNERIDVEPDAEASVTTEAAAVTADRPEAETDVGAPEPVAEPVAGPAPIDSQVGPDATVDELTGTDIPAAVDTGTVLPAPRDVAADAVEEMVVERTLAEQQGGHAAADEPAPGGRNGRSEAPRTRRGRVTRTGGAPAGATGEAPTVAVVTVPSARPAEPAPVDAGPEVGEEAAPTASVPPQPEPTATTRRRRGRRAASRPAGPPVADARTDPDGATDAGQTRDSTPDSAADPV